MPQNNKQKGRQRNRALKLFICALDALKWHLEMKIKSTSRGENSWLLNGTDYCEASGKWRVNAGFAVIAATTTNTQMLFKTTRK